MIEQPDNGPMDRRTLPHQLEELITELLIDGHLPSGQKVQEEQLCREFGCTGTPMREAFRALASRGLLDHTPNRGCQVPRIDMDELLESYAVREVLEGLAARPVATRVTDEQVAQLERLGSKSVRMPLPPSPRGPIGSSTGGLRSGLATYC